MSDLDRISELNLAQTSLLERNVEHLADQLDRAAGATAEAVMSALMDFNVAAPSWAVGTGGTRFGRFPIGGEPRTPEEKIDDVSVLKSLTASNGSISLHVPWDDPEDPEGLREYAAARSIQFDAMNSNTFQDNPSTTADGRFSYKFGSLANADPAVREVAVEHNKYVVDLGVRLGSKAITVWLADGINHPGQADHRIQFEELADAQDRNDAASVRRSCNPPSGPTSARWLPRHGVVAEALSHPSRPTERSGTESR